MPSLYYKAAGQSSRQIQCLSDRAEESFANLQSLNYVRSNKGKTSGSRIMFVSEEHETILLHKPHPQKELKNYQIKQLIESLEQMGNSLLAVRKINHKYIVVGGTHMNNTIQYKGYIGSVEFSEEDGLFYGKVMGIRSLISYYDIKKAKAASVSKDAVLLWPCKEKGLIRKISHPDPAYYYF